jgi:ribosomal protein S18 acetylase RimI-like enzyme
LPAVKIGRLGVHTKYQKSGIGTQLLDTIKFLFIDNNKTGCRYITVDAYNNEKTIPFYRKNGFNFLTESDSGDTTRLMYFDLRWFIGGATTD